MIPHNWPTTFIDTYIHLSFWQKLHMLPFTLSLLYYASCILLFLFTQALFFHQPFNHNVPRLGDLILKLWQRTLVSLMIYVCGDRLINYTIKWIVHALIFDTSIVPYWECLCHWTHFAIEQSFRECICISKGIHILLLRFGRYNLFLSSANYKQCF